MAKKQFTVEGMSCGGCSSSVERIVCAIKGVEHAEVVLETKQLTVTCSQAVSDDQVKSAVADAGFEVI